jgi:type IV secretion system protein VirD4
LKQELQEVRAANVARDFSPKVPNDIPKKDTLVSANARGRAARAAVSGGGRGQLSLDIEGLGIDALDNKALASAVQTTRAIIAEHA